MGKWIRRAILFLLLAVFVFSAAYIIVTLWEYRSSEREYAEVAEKYTITAERRRQPGQESEETPSGEEPEELSASPIIVDFEALLEENEDIIGWLYCEGTAINYPVLHGKDNDQYIRHSYKGKYETAGSIFVESLNRRNFEDSNTIIYGHHMRNGTMFACLDQYQEQEFYEEHPVMWLLTPEHDYRIRLFSAYTTSGYSDTYTIFMGPGDELNEYLKKCLSQSDFQADFDAEKLDGKGKYVVLSTCAYDFQDARYVVHGVLEEVEKSESAD